jgi:hypothetical protein
MIDKIFKFGKVINQKSIRRRLLTAATEERRPSILEQQACRSIVTYTPLKLYKHLTHPIKRDVKDAISVIPKIIPFPSLIIFSKYYLWRR